MPYTTMPIVGAFYRPPAQALINILAIGTPLFIIAEPDNPADPNAVAVWLATGDISEEVHGKLDELGTPFGFPLDTILSQDQWQLGYVPKAMAAALRAADIVHFEPVEVAFALNRDGVPRIMFAAPVL